MEFDTLNKPSVIHHPVVVPPAPAPTEKNHPGLDLSCLDPSTGLGPAFWDWHSWIIMGLLLVIGYHLWAFRKAYFRVYNEIRRSIRNRYVNTESIELNVVVAAGGARDTTTISLYDSVSPTVTAQAESSSEDENFEDCEQGLVSPIPLPEV